MTVRRFVLPGLTLGVTSELNGPAPVLRPIEPFLTPAAGPLDHEILFRPFDGDDVPLLGKLIWSGLLIDGTYAEISRDGDILQFRMPGRFSAVEQPGVARTVVDVIEATAKPLAGMAPVIILDMALRGHGLMMAHAATLLLPDESGVVLLFAPSGSGKTTTSLILALAGYGHFGDDVAILRNTPEGVRAWGMPRPLKVHRQTAAMLPLVQPWLGSYDAEDEARLTPAALSQIAFTPEVAEHPVRATVLVGKRSDGPARLAPITKVHALSEILADNVGMLSDGVPSHSRALFSLLSQLVAVTPSYRLDAGSDPAQVATAFDEALEQSRS